MAFFGRWPAHTAPRRASLASIRNVPPATDNRESSAGTATRNNMCISPTVLYESTRAIFLLPRLGCGILWPLACPHCSMPSVSCIHSPRAPQTIGKAVQAQCHTRPHDARSTPAARRASLCRARRLTIAAPAMQAVVVVAHEAKLPFAASPAILPAVVPR